MTKYGLYPPQLFPKQALFDAYSELLNSSTCWLSRKLTFGSQQLVIKHVPLDYYVEFPSTLPSLCSFKKAP